MTLFYHFVGDTLRDSRPVPNDGEWLEHTGAMKMCESGLHASPTPWDALQYAPGPILCVVELEGEQLHQPDKTVARKRKILKRIDLTNICLKFARDQALSVIHLWSAPDVMIEFLKTGKQELRAAALADARAAAVADAWAAAVDAASDAARAAASEAAWADAWAAAVDAASDAARAAASEAARANASDAASDAAWAAAVAAAVAAAWAAAVDAASDAASDAARADAVDAAVDAAWAAAKDQFNKIVIEALDQLD